MIDDKGEKLTNGRTILNEQRKFYSDLYAEKDNVSEDEIDDFLAHIPTPVLNEQIRDDLEIEITLNEISIAVKDMKNNKSPGIDGFPIEFFKFFWRDLKVWVYRFIKESFNNNCLNFTVKRDNYMYT